MNICSIKSNEIPMAHLTIIPATSAHIRGLKENIRAEDANEIVRFGASVSQGLWWSYRNAVLRKTAFIDGNVAAIWGVNGSALGKVGTPWLMTTHEVTKISPLRFAKIYQNEVLGMLKLFPKLVNYVDADYTAAIRLLDIIGFTLSEPEPMGNNGAMYRKFWI